MAEDSKPLSDLVGQGWEIVGYAGAADSNQFSGFQHSVLLCRQRQHKVVTIRKRTFGSGLVVDEMDI
jgi:hypothetical protein